MKVGTAIALTLLAALTVLVTDGVASDETTPPREYYRVVDGKVDRATYTGWQVFRENCSGCHGAGAVGTPLAPGLTERIMLDLETARQA